MSRQTVPGDSGHYRKTDFPYSYLVLKLFGNKEYSLINNTHKSSDAKRIFKKYCTRIEKAVKKAPLVDRNRKQALLTEIHNTKLALTEAKCFDTLDQVINVFQMKFITLLLESDSGQIHYVQNVAQKQNIIFRAIQGKYKERFGEWGDFLGKIYSGQCQSNPEKLVEWVRINHQDMYCDLF